jgi:hypothetical protein
MHALMLQAVGGCATDIERWSFYQGSVVLLATTSGAKGYMWGVLRCCDEE